jgi:N-acetylmuramoyl-L-alanine amidase
MSKIFALCVGHSRGDWGAVSLGGVTEHTYNRGLARMIADRLTAQGIKTVILDRYEGGHYRPAMEWVAAQLKELNAAACVELHFNAGPPAANGHEWLFWEDSFASRTLARALDREFRQNSKLHPRGTKPCNAASRGGDFLRLTPCPAVICEPFFGTNEGDWDFATTDKEEIAINLATGIAAWWKGLKL